MKGKEMSATLSRLVNVVNVASGLPRVQQLKPYKLPCVAHAASKRRASSRSRSTSSVATVDNSTPRIFAEQIPAKEGGIVHLKGDDYKHVRALRLKPGANVDLCDGEGCVKHFSLCTCHTPLTYQQVKMLIVLVFPKL